MATTDYVLWGTSPNGGSPIKLAIGTRGYVTALQRSRRREGWECEIRPAMHEHAQGRRWLVQWLDATDLPRAWAAGADRHAGVRAECSRRADEAEHRPRHEEPAMTDTDDTYNGWTNRETWAAHLWITNDQAIDTAARELVHQAIEQGKAKAIELGVRIEPDTGKVYAEDALREWLDEYMHQATPTGAQADELSSMRDDIGSTWRIDWRSIVDALTAE